MSSKNISPTKKILLNWIKINGRLPSQRSSSKLEKLMSLRLKMYISPSHHMFDPNFRKKIRNGTVQKPLHTAAAYRRKQKILTWIDRNGRLPHRNSKNSIERKIGCKMENLLCPSAKSFDPKFRQWVYENFPRKIRNKRKHDRALRMKEVLEFISKNLRIPSRQVKSERIVAFSLENYTSPASPCYNASFHKLVKKLDKCFKSGIPVKYRASINLMLGDNKLVVETIK